jgi:hypothetical protein
MKRDGDQEYVIPPSDPLRAVFSRDIVERLRNTSNPSKQLLHRIAILEASGPPPSDPRRARTLRYLRARKAAWDTYLYAAFACGFFEGEHGLDLQARLRGRDDDVFRAAMAECLACWFFAGRLKLRVEPRPLGRKGKTLDLLVKLPEGSITVEVKAPYKESPASGSWVGDDSSVLQRSLEDANKQFPQHGRNLLVIVPRLRTPVFTCRNQLIRAFYVTEKIVVPVNPQQSLQDPPFWLENLPEGKFLQTTSQSGETIKADGKPAFTRTGAVVLLEEDFWECYVRENDFPVTHNVLVLHNPHATKPIPQNIWQGCVQFLPKDGYMVWTDGHGLHP